MADNHTLAGSRRKRSQIAGIIVDHEKKVRHWKASLELEGLYLEDI
jgi:hypothetical protein